MIQMITRHPGGDWINIKCLAETLVAYDADLTARTTRPPGHEGLMLQSRWFQPVAPDNRISLASQALYEKVDEIRKWELLAGYLLHDHTSSSRPNQGRSQFCRGYVPESGYAKVTRKPSFWKCLHRL